MKITYNKNPLRTVIELDEHERKELWYKIKIQELEEILFDAHYSLIEGRGFNLNRARSVVQPDKWLDGDKPKIDLRVDQLTEEYIKELQSTHVGDCTCIPCSCIKCFAEEAIGINTLKGLRKHGAYKIDAAFGENQERTINEAINSLENYNPTATWEGWEEHAPRWKEEAKEACDWLKAYRDEHFKGETE